MSSLMFKLTLKFHHRGGFWSDRVVSQNSGNIAPSCWIDRTSSPRPVTTKRTRGILKVESLVQLFNGDFFGDFFVRDIWTSHPFWGAKIKKGGHNWIRESFYKSGFHWQKKKRFWCSKSTRTTSWVENENNQLIIRGPVWLAIPMLNSIKKSPSKFHKDKKSRYNYMRTQKETFLVNLRQKNRDQKDLHKKRNKKSHLQQNLWTIFTILFRCQKRLQLCSAYEYQPPHQWEWQDPRESRSPW